MNIQNLKPFQPGQSGNPKGRRPLFESLAEVAREEVTKRDLVGKLARIAEGTGRSKGALDVQVRAIALLLAYGWGQPRTEIGLQHSGAIDQAGDAAKMRHSIMTALEVLPVEQRALVARRFLEMDRIEAEADSGRPQ
jgi:hypothetical protein